MRSGWQLAGFVGNWARLGEALNQSPPLLPHEAEPQEWLEQE